MPHQLRANSRNLEEEHIATQATMKALSEIEVVTTFCQHISGCTSWSTCDQARVSGTTHGRICDHENFDFGLEGQAALSSSPTVPIIMYKHVQKERNHERTILIIDTTIIFSIINLLTLLSYIDTLHAILMSLFCNRITYSVLLYSVIPRYSLHSRMNE